MHLFYLLAQTLPSTAPSAPVEPATWQQLVATLLGTILTIYIVPILRKLASAANAKAEESNISSTQSLWVHLQAYVETRAAAIAEKKFPELAQQIQQAPRGVSASVIRNAMSKWGDALKQEAIDYFNHQKVDIVAKLGDAAVTAAVTDAADKASPLPGAQTSTVLANNPDIVAALATNGTAAASNLFAAKIEPTADTLGGGGTSSPPNQS